MLIAFSASHKDFEQTENLIRWCGELGNYHRHRALLVSSVTLPVSKASELMALCKTIGFSEASGIRLQNEDNRGWPYSCIPMFRHAAQWAKQNGKSPWLWLESDNIPLAPDWADMLEAEYQNRGTPFMGAVFDRPMRHLNGSMLYPQDISRYNQFMLHNDNMPWDLVEPRITMRHGHATHLMQRSLLDPLKNLPHSFPTMESLKVIREGVVTFHGCKDGSLINRLRERKKGAQNPKPLQAIVKKVVRKLQGRASYYHSGNLGDVIYALNAIRLHGGGDLVIGPEQLQTRPCSAPISQAQFNLLEPLLALQPYIKKTEWQAAHPKGTVEFDLNRFRNWWVDKQIREQTQIDNLCHMHCHLLDVGHLFDPREMWLTVGDPIWTGKIIVHRSQRHLSNDFPWRQLTDKYADKMLFVGIDSEWRLFQQNYGCRVSFYAARDFLDMARVIAGGIACVMNQSLPCAIALGLGQRVFQEVYPQSPDCRFQRDTFLTQITT